MSTATAEPARLPLAEQHALLEQWSGLMHKKARAWWRAYPGACEYADVLRAVRWGFVEAAARFDPARGVMFHTFAVWWADRRARDLCRQGAARGLHVPSDHPAVYPRVARLDGPPEGTPFDGGWLADGRGPDAPEYPADWWERACRRLSRRQRQVVLLHVRDGLSFTEIGRRLGFTKSAAAQHYHAAVDKLRRAEGLEGELEVVA